MDKIAPNAPNSYFFTEEDLPLVEMQHVFAQSTVWNRFGMDTAVITTDLVVREMPPHRNFLMFAGLEEMIHHILHLRFTDQHIQYLLDAKLIQENTIPILQNFKFRGDVYAMKEGTVFFPKEPVVRVTAPIIDANLIVNLQINTLVSNTIFTSKLVRSRLVGGGKTLVTANLRAHSFESGAKGTRASVLLRMSPLTLPYFNYKYHFPIESKFITSGQHLFIKSFPDELSAMRAIAETFPESAAFMVDTYDLERGMDHALIVAKELHTRGHTLHYVFVDSQPLLERTQYARKRLDDEGFHDVKICAGSNIEEYQIEQLEKSGAPIDIYCTVTESITSADAPKLEAVCKMAQMQFNGETRNTAKLSPGKESYPGVKQVFRQFDANGRMVNDVIGLSDENLGTPMLQPIILNGELVADMPSFKRLQEYVDQQLEQLPDELQDIHAFHPYTVEVSMKLQQLFEEIRAKHRGSEDTPPAH